MTITIFFFYPNMGSHCTALNMISFTAVLRPRQEKQQEDHLRNYYSKQCGKKNDTLNESDNENNEM